MSGWLSGGIPGLNRGAAAADGSADPSLQQTDPAAEQTTRDPAESATEHVKDDDASRWVAGYVTAASRTPRYVAEERPLPYLSLCYPYIVYDMTLSVVLVAVSGFLGKSDFAGEGVGGILARAVDCPLVS